jgi:hypothetical protein
MKRLSIFAILLLTLGCSKRENAASNDSLSSATMKEAPASPPRENAASNDSLVSATVKESPAPPPRTGAASNDSLLAMPLKEAPAPPPKEEKTTGLWIDSSLLRQKQDMLVLKRFEPQRVVAIYLAYRPLRNPSTTPSQLDSFLVSQKITAKELHSVLAEGDRLGWSKGR